MIMCKGGSSDNLYFLKSGEVVIELPLKNNESMLVDVLKSGSSFSVYDSFHEDMKQKYDYRASTFTIVETISSAELKNLEH